MTITTGRFGASSRTSLIGLEAALARHLLVEQQQVERPAPEHLDGVVGVRRRLDLVALLAEEDAVRLEQLGLVVHPEDGFHWRSHVVNLAVGARCRETRAGLVAAPAGAGHIGAVSPSPPYALATPRFRFRALAALAGRSPLGGEREVALATLLAARLAVGALPPQPLPQGVRITRANGARSWFAALALPATLRQPLARLVDATTSVDRDGLEVALRAVIDLGLPQLDAAAVAELRELLRVLGAQTP